MPNSTDSEPADIFDRSHVLKRIISALSWSLFLGSVALAVIVIWHCFHIRTRSGDIDYLVNIGFLPMLRIIKSTGTADSTYVAFSWLPGILWYYFIWASLGLLWSRLMKLSQK